MAVAYQAHSSAFGHTAGVTTIASISPGSGTDRVMVAMVTWTTVAGITVTSVVFNRTGVNESLTRLGSVYSNGNTRIDIFYRINPSNVTGTVECTYSGTAGLASPGFGVVCFNGADQTTPLTDRVNTSGANHTPAPNGTVTNVTSNDMAIDIYQDGSGLSGATSGTSQTERWDDTSGNSIGGSTQLGSASGVMAWTIGSTASWSWSGVRVAAASVGGGGAFPHHYYAQMRRRQQQWDKRGALWVPAA